VEQEAYPVTTSPHVPPVPPVPPPNLDPPQAPPKLATVANSNVHRGRFVMSA